MVARLKLTSGTSSREVPIQPTLAAVGLRISATGLGISIVLVVLVAFGILEVPWNARALSFGTMFVLVPYCTVGFGVSVVSAIRYRDRKSLLAWF